MPAPRELIVAVTDLEPFDADAAASLPRLPALEALLARAERVPAPPDWRRWVLTRFGLEAPPGDLPIGATLAAANGLATAQVSWLVATAVRLEPTLSHVRLEAAWPLRLPPAQARELALRATAALGGEGFELHAAGGVLLARFEPAVDVLTRDPAPLAGREIGACLPSGRDGGRVRRCMTELQMWLHAGEHGFDAATGSAPNALWLWGAGRELARGAARWPVLRSDDPWLQALHAGSIAPPADAGTVLATWRLASLAGGEGVLPAAEHAWFAPLAAALARGEHARVQLHLAGAAFELRPAQRWRFWRRPRPWWELAA